MEWSILLFVVRKQTLPQYFFLAIIDRGQSSSSFDPASKPSQQIVEFLITRYHLLFPSAFPILTRPGYILS
jgi:hypothetical protein